MGWLWEADKGDAGGEEGDGDGRTAGLHWTHITVTRG